MRRAIFRRHLPHFGALIDSAAASCASKPHRGTGYRRNKRELHAIYQFLLARDRLPCYVNGVAGQARHATIASRVADTSGTKRPLVPAQTAPNLSYDLNVFDFAVADTMPLLWVRLGILVQFQHSQCMMWVVAPQQTAHTNCENKQATGRLCISEFAVHFVSCP